MEAGPGVQGLGHGGSSHQHRLRRIPRPKISPTAAYETVDNMVKRRAVPRTDLVPLSVHIMEWGV